MVFQVYSRYRAKHVRLQGNVLGSFAQNELEHIFCILFDQIKAQGKQNIMMLHNAVDFSNPKESILVPRNREHEISKETSTEEGQIA